MGYGLKTLLLSLSFLTSFGLNAKTLKVDTVTPSVTNGDFTIQENGSGSIVIGGFNGVLKASSGAVSSGSVDLVSEISNVLGIANGGTNSSSALSNNFVMISSGGSIVESPDISTTELGFIDGLSENVQTSLNSKAPQSRLINTTSPIQGGGDLSADRTLSILQAGSAQDGYLSSADWNTFNSKEDSLSKGDLTESISNILTITGGAGSVIGAGTSIQVQQSSAVNDGYLSSGDWSTFNSKQDALPNVTNDAQLKRAANDINTFTEKLLPVDGDMVLIEDSEDSFNKKKVNLSNLIGGGSGGGTAIIWELNATISPLEDVLSGFSILSFNDTDSTARAWASFVVPDSYNVGDQITLEDLIFESQAGSGNILMKVQSYISRVGVGITVANNFGSSNSEVTCTFAGNLYNAGSMDITDVNGEIAGEAVQVGDIIRIGLYRDVAGETTSATEDARVLRYSATLKFDN